MASVARPRRDPRLKSTGTSSITTGCCVPEGSPPLKARYRGGSYQSDSSRPSRKYHPYLAASVNRGYCFSLRVHLAEGVQALARRRSSAWSTGIYRDLARTGPKDER